VFTTSGDPVRLGLVTSLVKPEGNLTGATQLNVEVAAKRLELMHEAIPEITNIALLTNPPGPLAAPFSGEVKAAAAGLGLKLEVVHASSEQDLDAVFKSLTQLHAEGLVIGSDAFFSSRGGELGALAVRYRVPAIYQYPQFTVSYGGNVAESYRLAGIYVGRILRETSRPAGSGGHQSRIDHQSQDRQDAGHYLPTVAPRPRRRGNRMSGAMSVDGPFATIADTCNDVRARGNPDVVGTGPNRRS
jgi:hypothetical protein